MATRKSAPPRKSKAGDSRASAETGERPVGRPSKYDEAFAEQARKLCLLGSTDEELADFFGVDVATVYRWKNEFPDFCEAIKAGKVQADAEVAEKLFHRAKGYSHKAVKIFMPAGAEEPVYADYTEHYPPDTAAAFIWLKNRQGTKWRDKSEVELTGNLAGALAERRKRVLQQG